MDEGQAGAVVERLRARGVFAHVHHGGVYDFGVRVVIPDGREAIWDADEAAGLEAVVMQDGMLVGFVPMVADSAGLDVDGIVAVIAGVDYDQEPGVHPDGSVSDQPAVFTAGAGPARPTVPEPSPPPTPPEPSPPPTPPEQSSPPLHPSRLRSSLLRRLSGH